MSSNIKYDPEHWRRRAEARRMIEHLDDDVARRTMQEIADSYEQLARRAEQLLDAAQTKR